VKKDGSTQPEVLVDGRPGIGPMTMDASFLYFTIPDSGEIWSIRK